MAGEYKAPCGCKIHVAQWTAKRKVVSQESCPLHKAAPELLEALRWAIERVKYFHSVVPAHLVKDCFTCSTIVDAETVIAKAEGKQ